MERGAVGENGCGEDRSRALALATDAAAGILGQQQHRGPLHDDYIQLQENAVYLAENNRPVEARAFPADAIIGAYRSLSYLLRSYVERQPFCLCCYQSHFWCTGKGAALSCHQSMLRREGGSTYSQSQNSGLGYCNITNAHSNSINRLARCC